MFYEAVKEEFKILQYVPGHIIAKKRHEKVVKLFPSRLKYVPDEIKAKVMCEKAIERVSNTLQYISDWFITLKVLEDFDNDVLITWRFAYKQSKIWKKQRERVDTYNMAPFRMVGLVYYTG